MRHLLILPFAFAASFGMAQAPCDSLATRNQRLAQELMAQRHDIDRLNQRVEAGLHDLEMTRKEAKVLRELMKGYINLIDSLNQENIGLRKELGRQ